MTKWLTRAFIVPAGLALLLAGCGSNDNANAGSASGEASPSASAASSSPSASSSSVSASSDSSAQADAENEAKLKVVTTFYPMYEFSRQVGGDHADVVALIPPGAEPHDWEPSAKDMARIQEADVFVYNGIVESWAEQALSSTASDKRVAVEASKGIELMEGLPEEEEGEEHDHGAEDGHVLDPHVWLDPALAQKEVASIEAAFVRADPAHEADYKANADAYIAKLKELEDEYRSGLADVKRKEFVTQHAAFGYLAKEYGLTQIPIAGLSPDQEPSPDRMADIVEFAKKNKVKTIFFETLVEPKVAQTVADEIGAKTDVLNPLEGLTDEDKKNGLDYIGIMKNNLAALEKALDE